MKVVLFSWEEFPQEAGEQGRSQETSPRSRVAADGRDQTRRDRALLPCQTVWFTALPSATRTLIYFFFIHNAWKVPGISDPGPGQTLTHVFTSDFSFHYLSTNMSLCRTGGSVSSEHNNNQYPESHHSSGTRAKPLLLTCYRFHGNSRHSCHIYRRSHQCQCFALFIWHEVKSEIINWEQIHKHELYDSC